MVDEQAPSLIGDKDFLATVSAENREILDAERMAYLINGTLGDDRGDIKDEIVSSGDGWWTLQHHRKPADDHPGRASFR